VKVARKIENNEIEISPTIKRPIKPRWQSPASKARARQSTNGEKEKKVHRVRLSPRNEVRAICSDTPYPFKARAKVLFRAGLSSQVASFDSQFRSSAEVAVIGRSNVGKSTLLNALVNFDSSFVQRAQMSAKPGETRGLTFYGLGPLPTDDAGGQESGLPRYSLVVVDMPGYGFAFMSEAEKERCERLSRDYLLGRSHDKARKSLKRVLLVLDARHGVKKGDVDFLRDLKHEFNASTAASGRRKGATTRSWKLQIVLTKCDLVERLDLCRRLQLLRESLKEQLGVFFDEDLPIVPLSGLERRGVLQLQQQLASLVPARAGTTPDPPPAEREAEEVSIKRPSRTRQKVSDDVRTAARGRKR